MKKAIMVVFKILLLFCVVGFVLYILGPKVAVPELDKTLPEVTSNLVQLEEEITVGEANNLNIKEDNQARIVWADSTKQKTPFSIVYLHGWSASQEEGNALHEETAKRYGYNLYLPRLAGHGLKEPFAMRGLTATQLIASAKKAIAIGKQLGDKVLLMATSTGGTLGIYLATDDKDIAGLILYSPNVEIYDKSAFLLSKPWGLALFKIINGSPFYQTKNASEKEQQYWSTKYHGEALTHLQALLDATMKDAIFKAITQPVFLGYYYKNSEEQDRVVSVPAMLRMYDALGTEPNQKRKVAFKNVASHVLPSYFFSKDIDAVRKSTFSFLEDVLGWIPRN